MQGKISPMRVILIMAMALFGFWLGNVGVQYALEVIPAFRVGADASSVSLLAVASQIAVGHPLGISLDTWPMVGGAACGLGMLVSANARKQGKDVDIRQDVVHGSQAFASVSSRAAFAHLDERNGWSKPEWCERVEDDNFLLSKHSKIAATRNPDFRTEQMCPNRHVFIMAGSGGGKTYTVVTPNALQLLGSYVFTDPKGELFRSFAGFYERKGYSVSVLNFRDEKHMLSSCRYNPLVYCDDITSINSIVEIFLQNTKGEDSTGDQMFFINMERNFYVSVIGLEVFWFKSSGNDEDCNLPSIIDYLLMLKEQGPDGVSNLDIVFNGGPSAPEGFTSFRDFVLTKYRDRGAGVLSDPSVPEVAVLNAYEMFKSAAGDPETMANVVSSCAARLQIFNNPAIRYLLSADDLDLRTMGSQKRALFLSTRDQKGPYDFIAAMVLDQLFGIAIDQADSSPSGHLDIPLWCMLDELANIGKIPNLEKLFATVRSRWINLVAIVQNGDQLKAVYGDKTSKSIRSNSGVFVYLGGSLFEDCEQISKEMGTTTRISTSYSQTTSASGGSVSKQTQIHEVPLMRPAELFNYNPETGEGFDPNAVLTHYSRANWFLDEKYDPTEHPRWLELQQVGPTDYFKWAGDHAALRDAERHREAESDAGVEVIDLGDGRTIVVDMVGEM